MIAGLQVGVPAVPQPRRRQAARRWRRSPAGAAHGRGRFALPEREDGDRQRSVFAEARRLVTWHYQWIIVNEFLPQIIGAPLVNDILSRGRRFYTPRAGRAEHPGGVPGRRLPLRPQHGAAVVPRQSRRRRRRARSSGSSSIRPARARPIRSICAAARGRRRRFIGWQTFFDFGGAQTGQRAAAEDDRHEDLDAAVPPAAGRDRQRRPADRRCRSATCSAT